MGNDWTREEIEMLFFTQMGAAIGRYWLTRPPRLEANDVGIFKEGKGRQYGGLDVRCGTCRDNPLVGSISGLWEKGSSLPTLLTPANIWFVNDYPGPVKVSPGPDDEAQYEHEYRMRDLAERVNKFSPDSLAEVVAGETEEQISAWRDGSSWYSATWAIDDMPATARAKYDWQCRTCERHNFSIAGDKMAALLGRFPLDKLQASSVLLSRTRRLPITLKGLHVATTA